MICKTCRTAADQPDYTLHDFCRGCDCQHKIPQPGKHFIQKDKKDVTQD